MAWDYLIIGAGTAGIPAAIFASRRGARVLLIDAAPTVGGTLHIARGQISAAETHLQKAKGIADSVDAHYDDVMRLSQGTADPEIVKLAVREASGTVNWLLEAGLVPLPDQPVTGESPGRLGYATPRYLWGEKMGKAILAVLEKELEPEVSSGRIDIRVNARATELLRDASGGVIGARVMIDNREEEFLARYTLLTTGGYSFNPELFEELTGAPAYTGGAYPFARGDGILLTKSLEAGVRNGDLHRPGLGAILSGDKFPATIFARFNTMPEERMPWEIWVDSSGRRFMREDEANTYDREKIFAKLPKLRYSVVFDEDIFQAAPPGVAQAYPGVAQWTREQIAAQFDAHPMFIRADTLAELAAGIGVDPDRLEETVRRYNAGVANKSDEFGRAFMPMPIVRPPFYAIVLLAHSVTSAAGLTVDGSLRVLNSRGVPIPGLYAAGELLGSGATLGNAFVPGMMIGPAMSLGRMLGMQLPL